MNLKGSKTEANILTAFAGESQARNKYTYYASLCQRGQEGRLRTDRRSLFGDCG